MIVFIVGQTSPDFSSSNSQDKFIKISQSNCISQDQIYGCGSSMVESRTVETKNGFRNPGTRVRFPPAALLKTEGSNNIYSSESENNIQAQRKVFSKNNEKALPATLFSNNSNNTNKQTTGGSFNMERLAISSDCIHCGTKE